MLFCFGGESFGNASEIYKRVGYDVPLSFFFLRESHKRERNDVILFFFGGIRFRNASRMDKHEKNIFFHWGNRLLMLWECINVRGMLYVVFGSRLGILLCDL